MRILKKLKRELEAKESELIRTREKMEYYRDYMPKIYDEIKELEEDIAILESVQEEKQK